MSTNEEKSKKKTGPAPKNLGMLLRHFIGLEITIELKTGRIYSGRLNDADDFMNLVLEKVQPEISTSKSLVMDDTYRNSQVSSSAAILNDIDYKLIHIRGPRIRYIHFPDNADLPRLVRVGLDRAKAAKDKYARGIRTKRSATT